MDESCWTIKHEPLGYSKVLSQCDRLPSLGRRSFADNDTWVDIFIFISLLLFFSVHFKVNEYTCKIVGKTLPVTYSCCKNTSN